MSIPTATPPDAPTVTEPVLAPTAQPTEFGSPLAIHAGAGWVRWSRFAYELPPDHAGRRRSLWRQLKRRDAVKLQHGEWAIAHDENDEHGMGDLVAAVQRAGGTCELDPVGHSGIDDVERHVRLCRSCEALWDPFFNAVDRVARARRDGITVDDVDRLRRRYTTELARDVVLSDSARRAAERLDELGDDAMGRVDGSGAVPRIGTQIEVIAGSALDSDRVRYLAQVQPLPPLLVERAFRTFESGIYRPSAERILLRHGVFVFTCPRSERETIVSALRDRLSAFATYQC